MAKLWPSTRGADVPAAPVQSEGHSALAVVCLIPAHLASPFPAHVHNPGRVFSSLLKVQVPLIPPATSRSSFSSLFPALVSLAKHLTIPSPFLGRPDEEGWPKEPPLKGLLALDAVQLHEGNRELVWERRPSRGARLHYSRLKLLT